MPSSCPTGLTTRLSGALLTKHNLEIGGAMGPLAGRVWRVGLMAGGATRENLLTLLNALEDVLGAAGYGMKPGAATSAAESALA